MSAVESNVSSQSSSASVELVEDNDETLQASSPPRPASIGRAGIRATRQPSSASLASDFCPSVVCSSSEDEGERSSLKRTRSCSIEEEESENCLICFEPWTNSGHHRIVSLRCGHLFGKSCVEKWARNTPRCPQCQTDIRRNDIRVLYTKSIKVLDTSELEETRKRLQSERSERKRLEIELADCRLHCQILEMNVKRLEKENKLLQQHSNQDMAAQKCASISGSKSSRSLQSRLLHCSPINMDAGGRAITHSPLEGLIIYSQQSLTPIFRGSGVVKVNVADPRLSEFVPLHKQPIRDLSVNPINGILLSCSMDRSAKLVDLRSNSISQSYELTSPLWSCTWNKSSEHYLYLGLATGAVHMYDTRMPEGAVDQMEPETNMVCPVVCLEHVRAPDKSSGGVLVGRLLRASLYSFDSQSKEHRYYPIPSEGSVMSSNFENETGHLVVTLRPSSTHHYVRHEVYSVNSFTDVRLVNTVRGSKTAAILTRAKLLKNPASNDLYVWAFDEHHSSLSLSDVSNSNVICRIPSVKRVSDLCPVSTAQSAVPLLAAISPDAFRIYSVCL